MGATSRAGTAGFLLLALMASPAAAKEEMLCPGTVIPLTLTATHSPYVRSSVSGQGGYFQVDTGASISTVDARRFRRPVGTLVLLDDFAFPKALLTKS